MISTLVNREAAAATRCLSPAPDRLRVLQQLDFRRGAIQTVSVDACQRRLTPRYRIPIPESLQLLLYPARPVPEKPGERIHSV